MTVVVSIGGSVFARDLDPGRIRAYAEVIADLTATGRSVGVVVGGGRMARQYIEPARALGASETELDRLGIGVTRLNARLLIAALAAIDDESATPAVAPARSYTEAHKALRRGEVPVMGGTEPAHTTDAVSAALAEDLGADQLVYATSASGVFEADPNHDETARRYEQLQAGTLVELIARLGSEAGGSAPVDLLAAKVLQRAEMEAVVVDGTDPETVSRAVLTGEFEGTRVIPDGTGPDRFADPDAE